MKLLQINSSNPEIYSNHIGFLMKSEENSLRCLEQNKVNYFSDLFWSMT
jgi:hypothetical protein